MSKHGTASEVRPGLGEFLATGTKALYFASRELGQTDLDRWARNSEGFQQALLSVLQEQPISEPEPAEIKLTAAPRPLQPWGTVTLVSETATEMVFRGKIRRGRTPQQVLDATKRAQYKDATVVATMPLITSTGEEETFEYVFFKPGRQTSDAAVETERTMRELIRDLEVQALINALIPAFADQHPNGDSWQDADGNWCFADFSRVGHERYVSVDRGSSGWSSDFWFGGRKVSK